MTLDLRVMSLSPMCGIESTHLKINFKLIKKIKRIGDDLAFTHGWGQTLLRFEQSVESRATTPPGRGARGQHLQRHRNREWLLAKKEVERVVGIQVSLERDQIMEALNAC